MDASFWIHAWEEGRTSFHQSQFNEKLTEYFPKFLPQKNQKVLVPLCGKSLDMLWLKNQGLEVWGVELYQEAAASFFSENNLNFEKKREASFTTFVSDNLRLLVGDFFSFNKTYYFDFIYDRASLVALPPSMRSDYASVVSDCLRAGGKYLLIVFEYDQSKLAGPPFSISDEEVRRLYQEKFSIELIESQALPTKEGKFSDVDVLKQNVYLLEKKNDSR